MSNKRKIDQRAAGRYQDRGRRREPAKATGGFATAPGQLGARLLAAGALGSVAVMAMHAGAASAAGPQQDHTKVTSATLTADQGLPSPNALFPPLPAPKPTQFLSGSTQSNTVPQIPGVTQNTTLSTFNPGGGASEFQSAASLLGSLGQSGLSFSPPTSRGDLGTGNFGVAPEFKFSVDTAGNITLTPGFTGAVNIPGVGGGSFVAPFPLTIDNKGTVTFTQFDKTGAGIANLFGDPFNGPSNTTNTTGRASDQPADPNLVGNFPGGTSNPGLLFPGGPLFQDNQMLTNQQFQQLFSNSSTMMPASGSIGPFGQDFTLGNNPFGGFAFTPPAAQTLEQLIAPSIVSVAPQQSPPLTPVDVATLGLGNQSVPGLPVVPPLTPPVLSSQPSGGNGGASTRSANDASLQDVAGGGAPAVPVVAPASPPVVDPAPAVVAPASPPVVDPAPAAPGDPSLLNGTPLDQQQVDLVGGGLSFDPGAFDPGGF